MPEPAVDLIIPALNEVMNIDALAAALPRRQFRRVVLVDNGSIDGTAQRAAAVGFCVLHEPRRGYGAACLRALEWMEQQGAAHRPSVVAFIDADLADDPAALPSLVGPILAGEADLVIGSRVKQAAPGALTATQRFGNALACGLMRPIAGTRFTDLGPMRAIAYDVLLGLNMNDRTWGWTVQMQLKAAMRQLRIMEIDVPYRRRHAGRSKISGSLIGSMRAGYRILATIAQTAMERDARPQRGRIDGSIPGR